MPFPAGCGRSSLSTSISFHCSRGTRSLAQPILHPDSTFHHLQEPQDPRNLHAPCHGVPTESLGCLQRALAALLSTATSLFHFQPPFPLCFPFPTSSLCFPLPSPQSGCLFLGFHLKQERDKSASKPCPRHCCRMWGLQGTSHTHTHTGPSWLLMALLHPWNRAAGKAQLWELCFHKVMEEIKETQLELSRADEKKNKRN